MSYLIDTNVLSELRRRIPEPKVVRWIEQRPPTALFLSVLTLGELRKGIERMALDERRQRLLDWLDVELPGFFAGRVLPITAAIAHRWGKMQATAGRPIPAIDSLLAATALQHDLTLVTRNVRDLADTGAAIIDPWSSHDRARLPTP